MSTKFMITLNYQRSLSQAQKLEELAEKVNQIGNTRIDNAKAAQAEGWKGDNANVLRNKTGQLQVKIQNTAKSLKNTASTIRKVAKNTYDAEMRAWEIAHRRDYGGG